jgi:hypothetical protein
MLETSRAQRLLNRGCGAAETGQRRMRLDDQSRKLVGPDLMMPNVAGDDARPDWGRSPSWPFHQIARHRMECSRQPLGPSHALDLADHLGMPHSRTAALTGELLQ